MIFNGSPIYSNCYLLICLLITSSTTKNYPTKLNFNEPEFYGFSTFGDIENEPPSDDELLDKFTKRNCIEKKEVLKIEELNPLLMTTSDFEKTLTSTISNQKTILGNLQNPNLLRDSFIGILPPINLHSGSQSTSPLGTSPCIHQNPYSHAFLIDGFTDHLNPTKDNENRIPNGTINDQEHSNNKNAENNESMHIQESSQSSEIETIRQSNNLDLHERMELTNNSIDPVIFDSRLVVRYCC